MCCQSASTSKTVGVTLESSISNKTLVNTYFDSAGNTTNMGGEVTTNVIWQWFLCNNLAIISVINQDA
jgi:hypothetical protein